MQPANFKCLVVGQYPVPLAAHIPKTGGSLTTPAQTHMLDQSIPSLAVRLIMIRRSITLLFPGSFASTTMSESKLYRNQCSYNLCMHRCSGSENSSVVHHIMQMASICLNCVAMKHLTKPRTGHLEREINDLRRRTIASWPSSFTCSICIQYVTAANNCLSPI